jgi:hemoglobin
MPLPVDGRHFDRWVTLFEATARDVCPPAAAAILVELARRIAESLERGGALGGGVSLQGGERLHRDDLVVPGDDATPAEPAPRRRLAMRS